MIKYKYVCNRCGFETEELIQETKDGGYLSSCPVGEKWELIHGSLLCPTCTKDFYDFVDGRELEKD